MPFVVNFDIRSTTTSRSANRAVEENTKSYITVCIMTVLLTFPTQDSSDRELFTDDWIYFNGESQKKREKDQRERER